MRHGCPKRIQTDGIKPYFLAGINSFFDKFNIVDEVSAPHYPESNGMTERLLRSLKDRLVHINKDQGFTCNRI